MRTEWRGGTWSALLGSTLLSLGPTDGRQWKVRSDFRYAWIFGKKSPYRFVRCIVKHETRKIRRAFKEYEVAATGVHLLAQSFNE